jgi:hypothetical protein
VILDEKPVPTFSYHALGRKVDVSSSARLLTSIYLAAKEFEILSILPSEKLHKTRHYVGKVQGPRCPSTASKERSRV